ncbi:MAG TPA: hypothetical protein VM054_11015 [bacterium]|nr:hypothetical protein [bacterium]
MNQTTTPTFDTAMKTDTLGKRLILPPLVVLLLTAGCGDTKKEDPLVRLIEGDYAVGKPPETEAVTEGTDFAALYGPGRIVEEDPYSTVTPNGAWLNRSLAGNLFLVRLDDPAHESELGYVEAYRLPDLPERTAAALAAGENPTGALAEDLREIIENHAVNPVFVDQDLPSLNGYPSATLVYHDLKRDSEGGEEPAYNEATLLLVGGEAHIFTGYCFTDARELFVPELRRIGGHFSVKPPPPPPPKRETESAVAAE